MKKLLLLFLTLTISFANAQDKGYWVCFNVNVDAEGQEAFVNALDGVFNSEFSSQFPFAVTLNEIMFTSRDNKMTHQLCFLAPNAETMDMWGGGPPPTAEGSLVQMLINEYVEFEDSILGSGLNNTFGNEKARQDITDQIGKFIIINKIKNNINLTQSKNLV